MENADCLVRDTALRDIPAVAALHRDYIKDSVFFELGDEFLALVHNGIVSSPYGISYVLESGGNIAGFVAASTDTKKLFVDILVRNCFALLPIAVRYLAVRPSRLKTLVETFVYGRKTEVEAVEAELLFVALLPGCRKKGMAAKLLRAVLDRFAGMGIRTAKVTAVEERDDVRSHLLRCGFKVSRGLQFYGKKRILFVFHGAAYSDHE